MSRKELEKHGENWNNRAYKLFTYSMDGRRNIDKRIRAINLIPFNMHFATKIADKLEELRGIRPKYMEVWKTTNI